MNQQERDMIAFKTICKYQWLCLKMGAKHILHNRKKQKIVWIYIAAALSIWFLYLIVVAPSPENFLAIWNRVVFQITYTLLVIAGFLLLLVWMGTPQGANGIHERLWKIGFTNHAGEIPLLLRKNVKNQGVPVMVMEFETNGIPLKEWQDKQNKLESILNVSILKMEQGENKQRILLYAVSGDMQIPKRIFWKEEDLQEEDFSLVLGLSLYGKVTVNLAQIPHILLGGSTGSGKSMLLKLLIMQCVKKGATVYIADFKGGVDFPPIWHKNCKIVIDENALLDTLTQVVMELERRKELLRDSGCTNIVSYCRQGKEQLDRIIIACDEVAEVLDKTGLSKEAKEMVVKMEGKLSVIARQGRAFGIHCILATQRPDANILTGQIRNNIDYRVCGRADNVLSQIILDSTDAAEQIPKDAQGLFINHEGVVFRGYLFDEEKVFSERGK